MAAGISSLIAAATLAGSSSGRKVRPPSTAIEVGRIPAQPVEPLAHTLLGALREAALYLAFAQDRPQAAEAVGVVIDNMIDSLAAGDAGRGDGGGGDGGGGGAEAEAEKHGSADRTTDP